MSDFYANMAATAKRLIAKFGYATQVKRIGSKVVNPVTGGVTGTSTTYTVQGILQPYPDALINGTSILASDRLIIIDAQHEPLITDKFVIQGQDWAAISIKASNPAGTALVYFVQVRR